VETKRRKSAALLSVYWLVACVVIGVSYWRRIAEVRTSRVRDSTVHGRYRALDVERMALRICDVVNRARGVQTVSAKFNRKSIIPNHEGSIWSVQVSNPQDEDLYCIWNAETGKLCSVSTQRRDPAGAADTSDGLPADQVAEVAKRYLRCLPISPEDGRWQVVGRPRRGASVWLTEFRAGTERAHVRVTASDGAFVEASVR
jgi:hypothetical protein